jgi:hypothetical protein
MQKSKKIQEKAINLFFEKECQRMHLQIMQKETICKQLKISIYELDRILDRYYEEIEELNLIRLTWCQTHPNSYTLPKKQSFIDFIVQKEHEKQIKQRLKENNNFERGVAV